MPESQRSRSQGASNVSQVKAKPPASVFVSYSSSDAEAVLGVARQLEQAGVSIWRDGDRILGGHYYGEQIVHALAHSKVVLIMCSPSAFSSDNVHREILLNWDYYSRNYLPIWLSPRAAIPERFRYCLVGCQSIDVFDQTPEQWLPKVLAALEALGAAPSVSTASNDGSTTDRERRRSRSVRFAPGDRPVLGADWELERLLGKGGYGEVWLARNPHLPGQAPVALKFCFGLDAEAKELLRHEADMVLRAQRSANVGGMVPLLHTYLNNEPPCLEYPYIAGGTLVSLIDNARRKGAMLTPLQVHRIVERIARIVGALHRAAPQLVHRDLKPSNVLVSRGADGHSTIHVIDFGIGGVVARPALERSRSSYSLQENLSAILTGTYTPLYASPQQIQGAKPDPRDDVYSLGVIWRQLLLGNLTAPAPTGRRWIEPLKQLGMTDDSIELLMDCLEANREDRPADGIVLAKQLKELIRAETKTEIGLKNTSKDSEIVRPGQSSEPPIKEPVSKTDGPGERAASPNVNREGRKSFVTIRRAKNWIEVFYATVTYAVKVDDVVVANVRVGESLDFTVTPGRHEIQLSWAAFFGSKKLQFDAKADEYSEFECGMNLTGSTIYMWYIHVLFRRDQYLVLRQLEL
jgi:serine/threonine protein kinase